MQNAQPGVSSTERAGDIHDPGFRDRISAPGFRAFVGVVDKLGLTVPERCRLLGGVSPSAYHKWKQDGVRSLSVDQLERISLVLGIFKGLRLLFADDAAGLRWLKSANADIPFSGDTPLQTMLRGSIADLFAVRRYIDAWRGVWP